VTLTPSTGTFEKGAATGTAQTGSHTRIPASEGGRRQ
jgi:hypothetical protein